METHLQEDLVHDNSLVFIDEQTLQDKYIWDPWTKKSLIQKSQLIQQAHTHIVDIAQQQHSKHVDLSIVAQLLLFVASLLCVTCGIQSIIEENTQNLNADSQKDNNNNNLTPISLSLQFPFVLGTILLTVSFVIFLYISFQNRPFSNSGEADNFREIELVRTMQEVYNDENVGIRDDIQTLQNNDIYNANTQNRSPQQTSSFDRNSLSGQGEGPPTPQNFDPLTQQDTMHAQQDNNMHAQQEEPLHVPLITQQGDRDMVVVHGREMVLESPVDHFEFETVQELQGIIGQRQQSDPNSSNEQSSSQHIYDEQQQQQQQNRRESADSNVNYSHELNFSCNRVENSASIQSGQNDSQNLRNSRRNSNVQNRNNEQTSIVQHEIEIQIVSEENENDQRVQIQNSSSTQHDITNNDQNSNIQNIDHRESISQNFDLIQQNPISNSKKRRIFDFFGTCMFLIASFNFNIASLSTLIKTLENPSLDQNSSYFFWLPIFIGSFFLVLGNILYILTNFFCKKNIRVPVFSGYWWTVMFQLFGFFGIFLGVLMYVGVVRQFSMICYLSLVQWTILGFFLLTVGQLIGLLRLVTGSRVRLQGVQLN